MKDDEAYLHGAHPDEQDRLSRLNDLLNEASIREARVQSGNRVVDFGSGLGQLTRAFARAAVPGGSVVGIERDAAQRDKALDLADRAGETGLVDFRSGNVYDPPLDPNEWGSFDIAHARFVLEHVSDPQAVVNAMVQAVRPGGRVILQDDDHETLRCWPEPPGLSTLMAAYVRAISVNHNDPFIGRRLGTLLTRAGAATRRANQVNFGGCAGDENFPVLVENLIGVIQGIRARMLTEDLLDPADYDRAIDELRAWGKRPDAAIWYAVPWIEGHRIR